MKKMKRELRDIIKSVKGYMQAQEVAGIKELYLHPDILANLEEIKAIPRGEDRPKVLERLQQEVNNCKQCSLYKARTNPVFGQGDPQATIVFVGEAPGREEDLQGLPFVGQAGELLTRIIQAMGFKRQDVFICNVLKCRPPQNRNPLPSEIVACGDFLRRQLEIINPKIICCMGKFACSALLNEDLPISKLRGRFFEYRGIKVMPTFHPAYLLRNPQAKRLVWQDMQKIMAELKKK